MTDVQVLSAPANRPVVLPALEVLAEIPIVVLHRVIRGHAHIEIVKGKAIVCPDDIESADWIAKTLRYLGIPVAYWT